MDSGGEGVEDGDSGGEDVTASLALIRFIPLREVALLLLIYCCWNQFCDVVDTSYSVPWCISMQPVIARG